MVLSLTLPSPATCHERYFGYGSIDIHSGSGPRGQPCGRVSPLSAFAVVSALGEMGKVLKTCLFMI